MRAILKTRKEIVQWAAKKARKPQHPGQAVQSDEIYDTKDRSNANGPLSLGHGGKGMQVDAQVSPIRNRCIPKSKVPHDRKDPPPPLRFTIARKAIHLMKEVKSKRVSSREGSLWKARSKKDVRYQE